MSAVGGVGAAEPSDRGSGDGGDTPAQLLQSKPEYSRVGLVRSVGAVRAGSSLIGLALCSCLGGVVKFADLFTGGGASMAAALIGGSLLLGVGVWQSRKRDVEWKTIGANMALFSLIGATGGAFGGFLIPKLAATGVVVTINLMTALSARFADPKNLRPIIFGPIKKDEVD